MKKIVECVPNFSEGRDQEVIDAIAEAIRTTKGCKLLDVDPGASTNRTVYTFVGDPERPLREALEPLGFKWLIATDDPKEKTREILFGRVLDTKPEGR